MFLTKDGKRIELVNDIQIAAFIKAGYQAEEPKVKEPKSAVPKGKK